MIFIATRIPCSACVAEAAGRLTPDSALPFPPSQRRGAFRRPAAVKKAPRPLVRSGLDIRFDVHDAEEKTGDAAPPKTEAPQRLATAAALVF